MVLQHVMALVNAGYTKDEIEAMTNEEVPKVETPNTETEPSTRTESAKLEATAETQKSEGFSIDYDKLSQSMLKAFQSANIRQSQQPQTEKTDLSKFF